jgi:transcriptional regulator with XRE-family HTH domain
MPTTKKKASKKFLNGQDFRSWRVTRELTLQQVADMLGMTAQGVAKYESRGATRTTALALSAIEKGLKPWHPKTDKARTTIRSERPNEIQRKEGCG